MPKQPLANDFYGLLQSILIAKKQTQPSARQPEQLARQVRLLLLAAGRAGVHHCARIQIGGCVRSRQNRLRVLLHDDGRQAFAGLVQQQNARLARQCNGNLQQTPLAIGQHPGLLGHDGRQVKLRQQLLATLGHPPFCAQRLPPAAAQPLLLRHRHGLGVQRGEAVKQLVDERGFTRVVGADQGVALAFFQDQGDFVVAATPPNFIARPWAESTVGAALMTCHMPFYGELPPSTPSLRCRSCWRPRALRWLAPSLWVAASFAAAPASSC